MSILVTGSAAGLGAAIVAALRDDTMGREVPLNIIPFDIAEGHDVCEPSLNFGPPPDDLEVLVNCAGINRSDWLENFQESDWDAVMDVNAKGIFKMSQWALPALSRNSGTILNIVSNASHLPMRTSLAYNASKGAAHIMTLQLARELGRRHNVTVFGISPNKLAGTPMSLAIEARVQATRGWSPDFAREYQLATLPAGEETDPATLAEFVAFLLKNKQRHKYLAGCVLPYGV